MADFFMKGAAQSYDEKNRALAPIANAMHFLIRLILKDLPENARILCVGVGTGAEILSLSKEYSGWTFVGVDPSSAMLDVCRERLVHAGVMDRCELVHGFIEDVSKEERFDAVVSVLVGHFIQREERINFYQNMHLRLVDGGYLVNTEISFDMESAEFPSMLKNWKSVQSLMGATPESLEALPGLLKTALTVLPPSETESFIRASGFSLPVRFFQSFMIMGWYAEKGGQG